MSTSRMGATLVGTIAIALTLASTASARQVDVPKRLGSDAIARAHDSSLVVLLPSRINLDYDGELFADGEGDAHEVAYSLTLSGAEDCNGANACFLAEFKGEDGAALGYKRTNVKLALGMKGYYKPSSCGASCSPPSIQWIQKGVRYEIQAKALGGKAAFITLANSAIKNGNRK
ncbi:hypothetical protein OJ997_30140 [Solirubrobacter phytolaccae]|uniref:Uncharacterized protein n=1 Tax=Solirubrobacter phytolaccae TaxID=1404360 RepID=A0A9X3NJ61_9ACTN|nr:hypothetical protein [Solirubrobacter phytolaccae]MDA0184601.1 hypothetical protein [Solirubrobacter phytolaccae]